MKNNKGFTLVELILSLVILSILSGAAYLTLGSQIRLWNRMVGAAEEQQIKNAVLTRMVSDIRSAREVLPDSDPFTLSLSVGDNVIEYTLLNQKVRRKNNNYSSYLTDSGEIRTLTFSYPHIDRVKICLGGTETEAALRN